MFKTNKHSQKFTKGNGCSMDNNSSYVTVPALERKFKMYSPMYCAAAVLFAL